MITVAVCSVFVETLGWPLLEAHQLSSLMVKVVSLPEHQLLLGMVSTDS